MPSSSKKQANFMRAIAHSPSFAKKVGVKPSVGKDFAAADKGKKFSSGGNADYGNEASRAGPVAPKPQEKKPSNWQDVQDAKIRAKETETIKKGYAKGGGIKAKINRQDTKHGKNEMPFTNLNKHAGFKKGGDTKRFASGGSTDFKAAFRAARAAASEAGRDPDKETFEHGGKSYRANLAKADTSYRDEGRNRPAASAEAKATPSGTTNSGAATGRVDKASKNMPSDEQKDINTENFADVTQTLIGTAIPAAKGVQLASAAFKAKKAADAVKSAGAMERAAEGTARQVRLRTPEARNPILDEARSKWMRPDSARRADQVVEGMKKGGNVKESKAMVKKEVEFFKKKGAPKSMIKHEESEMNSMKKGGWVPPWAKKDDKKGEKPAKFAKGGGIESRGKTKGTVIKMATGGSVKAFAKGGGIEVRGKTRGKIC